VRLNKWLIILFVLAYSVLAQGFYSPKERYAEVENSTWYRTSDAEICTWYDDKSGAISVSFDDASYTQYEHAYPIMEKYGIKGTFSLVGEWTKIAPTYSNEPGVFQIKKMCWDNIVELHEKGHEIAAHGYSHVKYNRAAKKDSLISQMKLIKELIESKINGEVYTMHYPYSFTSDKIVQAAKEAGYLFGRSAGDSNNHSSPSNYYLLASTHVLNKTQPTNDEMITLVNQINGKWLVLMYHHLFTEDSREMKLMEHHKVINTYSVVPAQFDQQMQILSESDSWIAPIAVIGKYIKVRDNTSIKTKRCTNTYTIRTNTALDLKAYEQPITVKIECPWEKARIKGSLNDGIVTPQNNMLLFNILPGGTVKITKAK
jgi:peptidoglycan/xylan/chitin deacetylase (PgdA/CDA1 family)